MNKLYFLTGSQSLYGDEALRAVHSNSQRIVKELNELIIDFTIELQDIVIDSQTAYQVIEKANSDQSCLGIITWMHTFSPAKMWIKGLKILRKPLLHLHTQAHEKLPYQTIDMDFMNLNQSAHGDREYGYILSRLNIPHEIAVGYYKHPHVLNKIQRFGDVSRAIAFSESLKLGMFGSNMREVAVTDGDRVESQIKYGWEVNYYGIGDLVDIIDRLDESMIDKKMKEYETKYIINTKDIASVREQAAYEIALEIFMQDKHLNAFTDTFQDLHGLKQLPGLAVQTLMAKGYGFAGEGDYKTAALVAILMEMSKNRQGATGFMEDYTYDLTLDNEVVLGAHMLEISPVFAKNQPKIEVHPLGIGGKEAPARLVFDGISGEGISVCMTDMGTHFRMICADIELIEIKEELPKLPVARVLWKVKPNFKDGVEAWLKAGGGHHTVVSTALTKEDIRLFCELINTELIVIA